MVNGRVGTELKQALREEALRLGFASVGFTLAAGHDRQGTRLSQWLSDGRHGQMEWMEGRASQRSTPQGLWPEASSVIALGMSYAPQVDPLALANDPEKARISVYAQGRDYHDVVKKALKALARWLIEREPDSELKVFVDTAPVMEKPLGEAAGIGWQGKHTNLVSTTHGSWLVLGAIYSTPRFDPDEPHSDRCGSCRACQDACPTDAFPAPYHLDARRCISYLTIEHKGPVPEEFREAMGNRIYGCDDCLAVCPWNKFASSAQAQKKLLARDELTAPDLSALLALNDASFRQKFSGSPIKRVGRDRFVRNCLYAAGNSGLAAYLPQVEALTNDSDPAVKDAAEWAASRLRAFP